MMRSDYVGKLQYKCSTEYGEDVHFKHTWFFDEPGGEHVEKLWEVVTWCHENWDTDPNFDHEWHYRLEGRNVFLYQEDPDEKWMPFGDWPHKFWIGTNDDEWAVMFKLMWSELIA